MPKSNKDLKLSAGEKRELMDSMIGATGTQFFKGFFNISDADEYVADLKGSAAFKIYNRMRRGDGQVKMALLALTHPIINSQWSIVPPGDPEKDDLPTPKEIEATKLLNQYWFDDDFQWEQTLRQILSMYWAGFSVFEKEYAFDGKYLKPKRLDPRIQSTIVEWDVQDGALKQLRQYISAGETARNVWIPAEKLLVFTYDREGNDYRGQSVLRAAYKHWFYKDTFYRIQGMKIERWALGIPRIKQTSPILTKSGKDAAIEMAKNLRAHEKAYAMVPQGWELDLLDSGSGKMVDEQPAIDHHDKSILKCVMAQFLELGINDTGSRAVGTTLKDFYLEGLSFVADYVCEVLRQQCFREWTLWNFGADCRPPSMKCDGIHPLDIKNLADAYSTVVSSGAVEMDDPTEEYIRTQIGFPQKDLKTARKKNPLPNPLEPNPPTDKKPNAAKQKSVKAYYGNDPYVANGVEADTWIHFNRPLRPSEENLALREFVATMDDIRERIVKATRATRAAVADELLKQVAAAIKTKEPAVAQKIDYGDGLAQQLTDIVEPLLLELLDYGRQQVYREVGKKKIKLAQDSLEEFKKMARQFLAARAQQFTEISLDKLVDEARTQAAAAIRTGSYDLTFIKDQLAQFSENVTRRSAGYSVNEAFSFGRNEGAQELKDNIAFAEYSSVLDSNTCGPCQDLDGAAFELDSPEYEKYTPPLYNCEGGTQCRCIWVYVSKEEKPAQA